MIFSIHNMVRGGLIYGSGDTVAALLTGEFRLTRLCGMMLVGGTVYAAEIPNYFHWIDRRCPPGSGWRTAGGRTLLALAYFNPFWIARHLFFINLFSGQWQALNPQLLTTGACSFAANIPIAFIANYMIQNQLPCAWRFTASALFSAMMAIYYALSGVWFG